MKTLTTILLSVLLSGVGHSDDTASKDADWASLNINLAALKSWGTKRYTYSRCNPDGKVLKVHGTASLFTELADDKVILKDKFHLQLKPVGEGMASLELIQTCRKDNFLSPARIESKGEGYDDFTTFVATVAKGKATVRSEGEKQTVMDVPDGAITGSALWRLVTLVDRTPGKTYTYKYSLESAEMNLKEDFRLEVLPAETITSGGRQVECSKFKLTGIGIDPVYYWVTKDGVLQRLIMDGEKMMELESKP